MNTEVYLNVECNALYSRDFLKSLLRGSTWRVQVKDPNGTYNPESYIYYEGSDIDEVLRPITLNWGTWVLTEVPTDEGEKDTFLEMFGFKPRQFTIKLKEIL